MATKANVSRRLFVGMLGGTVMAAPAALEALAAAAPHAAAEPAGVGEKILSPLRPGARLARWTILSIEAPARGALGLVLEAEPGHVFRLEILARDASPLSARPPAETDHFAVFVENGGDGWSPTVEEQGIAAMAVATLIRRNEAPGDAAGFLTHAARIAAHGSTLIAAHPRVS